MVSSFSSNAVELVKEFEGLELKAYPDPGTGGAPWTIGYGHTSGVKQGDHCTEAEATAWLVLDMKSANDAVNRLISVELIQSVHDALVSFTYNVGGGALGESTLVRRLNAGEDQIPVLTQELPRWNKGGNGVMPG